MDVNTSSTLGETQLSMVQSAVSSIPASTNSSLPNMTSLFGAAYNLDMGTSSYSADAGYASLVSSAMSSISSMTGGTSGYNLNSVLANASSEVSQMLDGLEQSPVDEMSNSDLDAMNNAIQQIADGELGEAKDTLTDLQKKYRSNGVIVHALGTIEMKNQNYEAAEQYFNRAIVLAPSMGYESDLENAQVLQKDDEDILRLARMKVSDSDSLEDGITLLETFLTRNPENTEARLMMADSQMIEGDTINAIANYHTAIRMAGDTELGTVMDHFEAMDELASNVSWVQQLIGKTQMRQGDYEEAVMTLNKAASLAGDDTAYAADRASAYAGLAEEKLEHHDIYGALATVQAGAELDSDGEEIRIAQAQVYAARGEYRARYGALDDAALDYRTAAQKLGSYGDEALRKEIAADAYWVGTRLYNQHESEIIPEGEGDAETYHGIEIGDEVQAFQAAFDLDPDNDAYRSKLATVRKEIGEQSLFEGEYQTAANSFQRAFDLDDTKVNREAAINAYLTWGQNEYDDQDYETAIEAYRSAMELDESGKFNADLKLAEAYNLGGEKLVFQEKFEEAAEYFREALNYDPDNATYQANWDTYKYYL